MIPNKQYIHAKTTVLYKNVRIQPILQHQFQIVSTTIYKDTDLQWLQVHLEEVWVKQPVKHNGMEP